jgi:RND family efflux transporter MFP subunit
MNLLRCMPGIAIAMAIGIAGCQGGDGKSAAPPTVPREVVLAPVQSLELPLTIDVTGVLVAQEELVLGFQVAGRVQEMRVDVGDVVEKGELVAALDERDFTLARDRARAALMASRVRLGLKPDGDDTAVEVETTAPVREARATLTDAELHRDRTAQMVKETLKAQAELDAAEAAVEVASSRLQGAREQVRTWTAESLQRTVEFEQSKKNLADSRLVAPWPGRVAMRQAVPGVYVQVGNPVVTLLRTDPLRLRLPVPERLASDVRVGQDVLFTVDGDGDKDRRGTVRRLSPGIDRTIRTLLVEAVVDNAGGDLRPGAFCRARIVVNSKAVVLAVPKTAVQSFAGVDRLYEVQGGKCKARIVILGRSQGDLIEITRGIEAGAQIVQQPRGLVDKTPVTVKG